MVRLLLVLASLAAALPTHPNLILTPARAAFLRQLPSSPDPFAQLFIARTLAQAATLHFDAAAASTGAPNARTIVQTVYTLGVAAALSGNATFSAIGASSFLHAALAPSWDTNGSVPELNTGEMLHATALGLDWFYAELSPTNRSDVVAAIVARLALIRDALSASPPPWSIAFVSTESNWNMVILGGTVIATLAVEHEPGAPSWVSQLRADALANIMAWSAGGWGPSGAWPEGVNYGGYTTRYIVPLIASLLSATGSDGGLRALPGVLAAPRWLVASLAPTRPFPELWAYFDARGTPETIASYLALAAWAKDAAAAAGVKRLLTALAPQSPIDDGETTAMNAPLACLYYTPLGAPGDDAALPLVEHWAGPLTAAARSSWTDENATFIGFKAHNTSALWAHTHLDGGSFVFANEGQWFAQELGSDSYAAPGYFSKSRFQLYRTNISGHNTISFGGRNPFCEVLATYASDCPASPMRVFNATPARAGAAGPLTVDAFAVVNLTAGFARAIPGVRRVERGFIVGGGRAQLVTVDEVEVDGATELPIWWSLHTVANVSLAPGSATATLTTWNTTWAVTVSFLAGASDCAAAAFSVAPLNLLPPLVPTPSVSVLRLVAGDARACSRVVVAVGVSPPGVGEGVRPLEEWEVEGPLI